MKWGEFLSEVFNKPGSRTIRLALSLLFITLTTVVVMTIFQVAKHFFDPDMTIWESHIYTILFTGLVAPLIALFVLLKFDGLYRKVSQENEERKRVEDELRGSEAMFEQIIDASPIPMIVYREEKNYYINKKFIDAFGYTKADIPSVNEWWPLAYPDKAYCEFVKNRWYAAVDEAVKNKTSIVPQEVIVTCKDGSKKDVLVFFSSIGDMNLAILQDITERKRDGEKISHLASFPSLNPNPIVETDFDGNLSYMNPSANTIFPDLNEKGPSHPIIVGLKAIVNELEAEKKSYLVREVAVGDSYFQETIHKVPDKMALRIYALDITERKHAEDTVRKSDVRFRSLIQNSSDIIRILDDEGRIIFDSPSSEKILGYPPGYTLGKSPFDFIHPDDIKFVQEELGSVYDKRNSGIPIEFRIRKADGEYLWVESIGVNMTGVPGVDGIVITTRPIGERKKAEEELKAAKHQADLYLDLMGHDISNLHQIALGYLELARDMQPGEEQTMFLDKSVEVLQRSTLLIQNVRKLQKIHDGMFQVRDIDVRKMLVNIQSEYGAIPGKMVELNLNGKEACFVRANELLHDVFANLVNNAIKHTKDGKEIAVSLDIVEDNNRRFCQVAVEDDGPGIPDDYKERIFNRMHKGSTRGMGLGLYLVKSLVDSYGGKVWIEDRVQGDYKKGARFVVMLPAID